MPPIWRSIAQENAYLQFRNTKKLLLFSAIFGTVNQQFLHFEIASWKVAELILSKKLLCINSSKSNIWTYNSKCVVCLTTISDDKFGTTAVFGHFLKTINSPIQQAAKVQLLHMHRHAKQHLECASYIFKHFLVAE